MGPLGHQAHGARDRDKRAKDLRLVDSWETSSSMNSSWPSSVNLNLSSNQFTKNKPRFKEIVGVSKFANPLEWPSRPRLGWSCGPCFTFTSPVQLRPLKGIQLSERITRYVRKISNGLKMLQIGKPKEKNSNEHSHNHCFKGSLFFANCHIFPVQFREGGHSLLFTHSFSHSFIDSPTYALTDSLSHRLIH